MLVKDFASQGVSVMGEVEKPGVYPAMSTRRLYDLISLAGGFTPKAGKLVLYASRPSGELGQSNSPDERSGEVDGQQCGGLSGRHDPVVSKAGIVYVVGDVVTTRRVRDGE